MMKTIKQTIRQAWQQEKYSKSKWYNSLKSREGLEKYLKFIHNASLQNCLTHFQLGAHWLEVKVAKETTRRSLMGTKGAQVEDKDPLVKVCPLYDEVRSEVADLDFGRSVQEIFQYNCIALVARFLAHYKAIPA